MTSAPNYMGHKITSVLARELFPCRLEGDEPEEMEVIRWPLADLENLVLQDELTEGRAIAALYMTRAFLNNEQAD